MSFTIAPATNSVTTVGGGASTYSNVLGDFVATANNGAKTITLSSYASAVLSASLATKNFAAASIKRITSGGVVDSLPLTNIAFAANVLTLADMTANFAVGDTVEVLVQGPDKGFDETNDIGKVAEQFAAGFEDNTRNVAAIAVKPLAVSTYSWTKFQSNSFQTTNVKNSSGNVKSFTAINTTASVRYLQLHDTATTPGGGATATFKFLVPPNSQIVIGDDFFAENGSNFVSGIAVGNSSAASTYTAATAGDLLVDVQYI